MEEPLPAGPPFSPSIEVDDTLYLSGQVGLDPETREMASGIQAETKHACPWYTSLSTDNPQEGAGLWRT